MKRNIALGLSLLIGFGGNVMGQEIPRMTSDTTITMGESEYRICQDRPARPDWIENIAVKEAYRVLTITEIYDRNSYRAVVISEDCSCKTRYPDWKVAETEYNDSYRMLDQPEHTEARRSIRSEGNAYRDAAKAICRRQGNW